MKWKAFVDCMCIVLNISILSIEPLSMQWYFSQSLISSLSNSIWITNKWHAQHCAHTWIWWREKTSKGNGWIEDLMNTNMCLAIEIACYSHGRFRCQYTIRLSIFLSFFFFISISFVWFLLEFCVTKSSLYPEIILLIYAIFLL